MATAKKHAQRSHKTYSNNATVFMGFRRTAMSKAQMIKANENRETTIERILMFINRFRYRRNESK